MDLGKQQNLNNEEEKFEEKKELVLPLMKQTIAKYRTAFDEFQIPVDMQVDMFCVMLADLIPMPMKYAPLMGDYVRRTLIMAYKSIELYDKEQQKDGKEQ